MTQPQTQQMVRLGSQVYRWLLKAYPVAFHEEFADEMVWLFEDCSRDALQRAGFTGLVGYWVRIVPDWLITSIQERINTLKTQGANDMNTKQFDQQFVSTLAVFSRALRSGYNVSQTLDIIVAHAPEPTKGVFQNLQAQIADGEDFVTVIKALPANVPSAYLKKMVDTLMQQRETGGNLADKLDDLNRSLYSELGDDAWAKSVDLEDGYDFEKHYPVAQG